MTLRNFSQYKRIKIKNDVVITTYRHIPRRAIHWHCWKLMFCNYYHKYNHFLVFHKDMSKGSIHNKQIIFKVNNKSTKKKCKDLPKANQKSTIRVQRKSAKICPKLTKTSKQHDRHCCGIPVADRY